MTPNEKAEELRQIAEELEAAGLHEDAADFRTAADNGGDLSIVLSLEGDS